MSVLLRFGRVVVSRASADDVLEARRFYIAVDRGVLELQASATVGYRIVLRAIRDEANLPEGELTLPLDMMRSIAKSFVASRDRSMIKGKTLIEMNESVDTLRGREVFVIRMAVEDHIRLHEEITQITG